MHVFRSAVCVFSKRNSMCVRLHFDAAWQIASCTDLQQVIGQVRCWPVSSIGPSLPQDPSGLGGISFADGLVLRTRWVGSSAIGPEGQLA